VACLAVYVAAAVWMLYGMNYEIGDAIARTADARYMLFSRDPHLAAVGFVWLPLPVIGQLPFMLVLSPLHQAVFAGPLSTCVAGALVVVVLCRTCRLLRLTRGVSTVLVLCYALNPVTVWTAANGMSETWFLLFAAISLHGLLRWTRDHRLADLAVIALGLTGAMLVRYESLFLVPVIAALAASRDGKSHEALGPVRRIGPFLNVLRERAKNWAVVAFVVAMPAIYAFALWLWAEYAIERDPFYFQKALSNTGKTPTNSGYLPHPLTLVSGTVWSLKLAVALCPAIVLLAPILIVRKRRTSLIMGLGFVATAALFPMLIVVELAKRITSANPRYFEPSILFVSIAALWLAADLRPTGAWKRKAIHTGLVATLLFGWVTATAKLNDVQLTFTEQENRFFGGILGRPVPKITQAAPPIVADWKRVAADLDPALTGQHRVILDASVSFPADVFTRHPTHYIVDSDRDFQSIVADPVGKFDYLIQSTIPGPESAQLSALLVSSTDGHWQKIRSYIVADVYRLVPNSVPPSTGG
jgi:hypothetical protein